MLHPFFARNDRWGPERERVLDTSQQRINYNKRALTPFLPKYETVNW